MLKTFNLVHNEISFFSEATKFQCSLRVSEDGKQELCISLLRTLIVQEGIQHIFLSKIPSLVEHNLTRRMYNENLKSKCK